LTPVFCGRPQSERVRSGCKYPEACLGDSLTGSKKLYFLSQYTRRGCGKRLLKYVLVQLQELGYRSAFLMVLENNVSARSFYEKSGFTLADGTTNVVIGGQPIHE
jgi:GNAT superfamily N-acetyltransferase